MGGFELLSPPGAGGDPLRALNGSTNPPERWVWLGMNHLSSGTPLGKEQWLNTLAHEIGHVMLDKGHPDDELGTPGPASLPGTDRKIRLMRSGLFLNGAGTGRRTLVKAEWDAAEGWLIKKIDAPQ
ncbi:hypothetical protein GP486_008927 [Trichoglossum hirsutum]|uniref:Uncharacterized protein n=1 Tax=Trichoglossum hirsutum TaxID=265104 RepID=A0A9P8I3S4_9PEZI|nr:hypothetical protein GP486_008927 [Trichoglossum hirsutum]